MDLLKKGRISFYLDMFVLLQSLDKLLCLYFYEERYCYMKWREIKNGHEKTDVK